MKEKLEPYKLHSTIANSLFGADKVTLTVLLEQIGSISKMLDRLAQGEALRGYKAELNAELSDLVFHLDEFVKRWGYNLDELKVYGKERWEDRHPIKRCSIAKGCSTEPLLDY